MVWRRSGIVGVLLLAAAAGSLLAQVPNPTGVGEGAPDPATLANFSAAFVRGNFSTVVSLPAKDKVHRNGPGYIQDFGAADPTSSFSYLLAQADSNPVLAVQMCCQILALHTSIGSFAGKIGFPLGDPIQAPPSPVDGASSLQQNFEGGHVIIAIQTGTYAGQTFFIRDPYVSRWRVTPALALPISQEHDTTTRFNTTGTQQDFQGGVIVQINSGTRKGQILTVSGVIYQKYFDIGGIGSIMGYPIGDEFTISGRQRQNFEAGYIDYVPNSSQPAEVHTPVFSVNIDATPVSLQVGNVIQRTASVFDNLGTAITDRPVTWTTSNRSVIQIEGTGLTVTLRAVGPGFANVSVIVDGVPSAVLRVTVTSVCCLVGEGAPNSAITQAMQDALTRNGISPRLPTDNPVRRLGSGYVQEFASLTPATLGRFLVVKSDSSTRAFVVSGERLARYQQLGGVVSPLGFATSDANGAGRQLFENNYALASSPPVVVAGPITQKWAAMNYEAGATGAVGAEATPASTTIFGSAAVSQTFANGAIFGFTSSARNGQAYFAGGLILARYLKLNGPAGLLGLPTSDAFASGGRTQQNFEGGSIDFAAGDAEAAEHLAARTPAVSVFPALVALGGHVHISISGFAPGSKLAVSMTSQPDFEASSPTGAYSWDQQIRQGTAAGVYRITARDAAGSDRAEATYRVRAVQEVQLQLQKISGDNQNAVPGGEASLPLVVRLVDDAGNPIAGVRVAFGTIAGATVRPADATTDLNGLAQTRFRLPLSTGLALATAESGGRLVTFAARAEDARLTTFPTFRQSIDDITLGGGTASIHEKGSLLTALAALFRYYQDRGELPATSGLADPATLNQFLLADGFLPFTLNGRPELVVNPLRALAFVSDAADFESLPTDIPSIRDSLNQRRPVLLGLMLRSGDQNRGAHYVVATGVDTDGSILIYDPSPDWNRTKLDEYLNGFGALGRNWTATVLHAVRVALQPRSGRTLLVYGSGAAKIQVAATSGRSFELRIPALAAFDEDVIDNGDTADVWYLDGNAPQYQFSAATGGVNVRGPAFAGPLGPGVFRINPDPASFLVAPQTLTVAAEGLRNAAGFGARLAGGSLASLFGAGLSDSTAVAMKLPLPETLGSVRVTIGGQAAPLLFASPFQANLQLPFLPPGSQTAEITSSFGTGRFDISLDDAAPGIFLIAPNTGAVLNQDGTLNSTPNPAARGSVLIVFTTGLGAVAPAVTTGAAVPLSPLSRAVALVSATIDGQPAQVFFAGLAPGFAGLYQVNVLIPANLAPNAAAKLVIRAAALESNVVAIAVQ